MPRLFFKILIVLFFSFTLLDAEQLTDSFRLDAYGNVNITDSKNNQRDSLNFSGGFQGRYQLNDNISMTGQLHLEEAEYSNSLEDYESELKWLYIDYYFINDITFRLGSFQLPVFKASETGDIGYTYTWTESPLRTYGVFGCEDFKGAELLKNFSYENFDFLAQLSFGKSKNELKDGRDRVSEGKVDDLIGLTLKTTHDDFILNIGYLEAKSSISENIDFIGLDTNIDFNMYSLETEIYLDDYTFKAGLTKSELSSIFPDSTKYYSSIEYSYKDLTPYLLYSKENLDFKDSALKNKKIKDTKEQYIERFSLGLRYDYNANIVFKTSFSHERDRLKFNNVNDEKRSDDIFMGTVNVIF